MLFRSSAHPIDLEGHIALELPKRQVGTRAEDPVRSTAVESHAAESPLQVEHVVARDQVTRCVDQYSIAECPAGFFEIAEGDGSNDAVDRDPALLLKGPDRIFDVIVEFIVRLVGRDQQSQSNETLPDVGYLGTDVPSAQEGSGHVDPGPLSEEGL